MLSTEEVVEDNNLSDMALSSPQQILKQDNPQNLIIKEDGFTLLAEHESPMADVIFIHGLQGHPRKTWTYQAPCNPEIDRQASPRKGKHGLGLRITSAFGRAKKGEQSSITSNAPEVYWPMDLLAHDFPKLRIFTYGYDSKITHWFKGPAMQLDIYSYGESLLNGIEARRRADPSRPLIFIVHSLGGLVLKDVSNWLIYYID